MPTFIECKNRNLLTIKLDLLLGFKLVISMRSEMAQNVQICDA